MRRYFYRLEILGETFIVRLCPICGEGLHPENYTSQENLDNYALIELESFWNDKRIAILCCSCFINMELYDNKHFEVILE